MTKATAAQYRAAHERLLRDFREQVLRLRQVRATSAVVCAETRELIAKAMWQQRSSHLS